MRFKSYLLQGFLIPFIGRTSHLMKFIVNLEIHKCKQKPSIKIRFIGYDKYYEFILIVQGIAQLETYF